MQCSSCITLSATRAVSAAHDGKSETPSAVALFLSLFFVLVPAVFDTLQIREDPSMVAPLVGTAAVGVEIASGWVIAGWNSIMSVLLGGLEFRIR